MDSPQALLAAKAISIPLALIASGYGICASHNIVPRLYPEPVGVATPIFAHVFYTGGSFVVPTALTSVLASAYLAYHLPRQRRLWTIAAGSTLLTLAWTRIVMIPGIDRLIAISLDAALQAKSEASGEHLPLLKAWVTQNYVRSAMFFVGGVSGLWASLTA
ncbi:hypothetical protein Q7P35_004337 [Cladosporium inversicolor]